MAILYPSVFGSFVHFLILDILSYLRFIQSSCIHVAALLQNAVSFEILLQLSIFSENDLDSIHSKSRMT